MKILPYPFKGKTVDLKLLPEEGAVEGLDFNICYGWYGA